MDPGFHDYRGRWRDVPDGTLAAIAELLLDGGKPPAPGATVVRRGEVHRFAEPVALRLEDGTFLEDVGELPPDVPLGYHEIVGERSHRLIVGPGKCYLPQGLRAWGWTLQLYALRSRRSWGMGDLADLASFGREARRAGASVALLNPMHANAPTTPVEPSPYYPSSRCFRDPLYLRIEDVPGAESLEGLNDLAAAGRALNGSSRIDRNRVFQLKMEALSDLWRSFPGDPAFDAFATELGDAGVGFATYCALAERHGPNFRSWSSELQSPGSAAVEAFRGAELDRVRFHQWLQWLLDRQLAAASEEIGAIHDLAIGVNPSGADAWLWRDCFAAGVRIGAPPDDYNAGGQDWGIHAFDPVHLRAAAYDPFVTMLRSTMRHAAGIRFDHVMGLFRLFWIPEGLPPADGAYVRYPADDLLEILALESQRAEAFVIGEDLGTVEDEVRRQMRERDMLSYRLLWFEDGDASELPRRAMASANTHDLPTTAGLWTGSDIEEQEASGIEPNVEFAGKIIDRIERHLGVSRDAPVSEVVDRSSRLLAGSDCAVVTVAVEDVIEMPGRYNLPGTVGEHNWTTAVPKSIEELVVHPRFAEISRIFTEGRGG